MFRRLRLQFIVVATIAVSIMLISVIGILNASKYATSEKRINKILDLLSENNGVLPDEEVVEKILGRKTNPDIIVQYRYFSAYVDSSNKVITMNTEHIANLSDTDVVFYVKKILSGNNKYGNFTTTEGQKFAYKLNLHEDESKLIVVLDTTSYIEDRDDLIDTSVFIFVLTSGATGLVHRRLTLTSTDVPSVISIVKNNIASINCFFNNHWNPSGLELWQKCFFISSKSFYSLYITEA